MYIDGRKSWSMPQAPWRHLRQHLGFEPAAQRMRVERICSAVADTVPELKQHLRHTPGFEPIGARMLWEWNEGMKRLSERRRFTLPDWVDTARAEGLPQPAPAERFAAARTGESPLMAPRPRKRRVLRAS